MSGPFVVLWLRGELRPSQRFFCRSISQAAGFVPTSQYPPYARVTWSVELWAGVVIMTALTGAILGSLLPAAEPASAA
jgi:hypothetical protein